MKRSIYLILFSIAFLTSVPLTGSSFIENNIHSNEAETSNDFICSDETSIDEIAEVAGGNLVTLPISGTFCAGSTIVVNFDANGNAFGFSNTFIAQLSDLDGSFAAPINIGSVSLLGVINESFIYCLIPNGLPFGTEYRIRVISTDPAIIGSDNGTGLTIKTDVAPPIPTVNLNGPTAFCFGSATTFISSSAATGNLWFPGGVNTNPFLGVVSGGCYYTQVTGQNGCATSSNPVCIEVNTPIFTFLGYFENNQLVTTVDTTVTICEGDSAQLGVIIEGGVAPFDIFYTPDGFNFVTVNDVGTPSAPNTNTYTFFTQDPGFYQIIGITDNFPTNCGSNGNSGLVTIQTAPRPVTDFSYVPFCGPLSGEPIPAPDFLEGGTYTFDVDPGDGASVDPQTGIISGAVNGSTYIIRYTAQGQFCEATSTAEITVNSSDITDFSIESFCSNNESPNPVGVIGFAPGGTYSFTTEPGDGALINPNTGIISQAQGNTTYSVTYTSPAGVCQASSSADVTTLDSPQLDGTVENTICADAIGSISTSVSGGLPDYTYLWSTNETTSSISGLVANSYTVTVTDDNGCTDDTTFTIVNDDEPLLELVSSDATCGSDNGSIDLTVTEGSGSYEFLWSPGNETSEDLSDLASGAYSVQVTDLITTCVVSSSANVENANAPEAIVTVVNSLCAEAIGSITISIVDGTGTGTISYEWNNGETTPAITGLEAGSYSVIITDENNCELVINEEVINENQFTASSTVVSPTCANPSSGSIAIAIEGGTAPFTYAWSPNTSSTTATVNNLPSGTYTVVITDDATCTQTLESVIAPVNSIELDFTQIDATCGNADGSIDLTVNGGSGAYTYTWSNGADTEDVSNIEAGNYSVTVVDSADNSCIATTQITIINSNEPQVEVEVTNSSCLVNNGAVQLSITGGSGTFNFSWTGPDLFSASTEDITELAIGTYNVVITDPITTCEVTESATVSFNNPPSIVATKVNTTCGQANGIIDIEIQGGSAPIDFTWSNGAESLDQINLASGSYTLTVTDFNGCTDDSTFNVAPSLAPSSDLEILNPSCGNDTGSVVTTLTNATSPVTYSWTFNGAPFATFANITELAAGTYILTANDGNGCTVRDTAVLINPDQPTLETLVTGTICGLATGSIDLTVIGGSGEFSFSWENASGFSASTEDISDLPFGCYTVTVTDANGCEVSTQACVSNLNAPEIEFSVVNASCNEANGSVSANITGGAEPYILSWDGTASADTFINDLDAGTYVLLVIDNNGCETTDSVAISNSGVPTVNADQINSDCGDANNGSILLSISNGVAPYTFLWSPGGEVTDEIGNLAPGVYSVVVTDDLNCEVSAEFTIGNVAGPTLTFSTVEPACGNGEGSIDLIVSGGSGDYSYLWTGADVIETSEDQSNLQAGDYSVIVTDNQSSCIDSTSITLLENNDFSIDFENTVINPATCGLDNGSVILTLIGGLEPFEFVWCNGTTTQNITDLPAGACQVTITDASGCEVIFDFEIPLSPSPSFTTVITQASCDACDGSVEIVLTDAEEPVTISWNTGQSTSTITELCPGDYSATVLDGNGCELSVDATIQPGQVPVIVIEPSTVDSTLCGEATASIDVSIIGGVQPYTFNWNGPDVINVDTEDLSNLAAGTYTLTVTDFTGCEGTTIVNITNSDEPTLEFNIVQAGCGTPTGSIDLTVLGGNGVSTFVWSGPNGFSETTEDITGLVAGVYDVEVTSGNCVVNGTATVVNADGPTASISISSDTICSGTSLQLTVNLTGGAPYTFTYNDGNLDIVVSSFDGDVFTADVSPLINTTYTLISVVSDSDPTCQGSFVNESASVLVNPSPVQPTISTSGPLSFCAPGSVTLTSSSATGNVWSFLGPDQLNQSITVSESGIYFVSVTNSFGCTDTSETVEVISIDIPNVFAGNDTTVCAGEQIFFNATGADEFLWSPSIYLSGTIIANPVCTPLETSTYIVTGTNACGISADTIVVTVNPIINADLGPDFNACPNEVLNFSVEDVEGATYQWTSSSGFLGSDVNSTFSTQLIGLTTVSVLVTNVNGCVSTDTVTINLDSVPEPPTITALGATTFCEGESVILQASTGNFVIWSNGLENFDEILVTESGIYTVTSTDGICPSTSDTIIVEVTPLPETIITAGATTVCEGECVELNANAGSTPEWILPDNTLNNNASLEACVSGLYILTNTADGCVGRDSVEITILPSPEQPIITFDGPQSICEDQTTTLVSNYATGNQWLINGNEIENETNNTLVTNQQALYTVVVTNGAGCSSESESVLVTVKPISPLEIIAGSDTIVCGNVPVEVVLTASNGFETYTWSPIGEGQTITADGAGLWSVTAVNLDGCDATASINIIVAPSIEVDLFSPIIYDNYNVSVVGGNDGSIDLSISGAGFPTGISWTGPQGFTSSNEDLFNLSAGLYTVTLSDEFGCEIQDTITLIEPGEIVLPNGFTPNGDGFNDFYVIKGIQGYPDNQINIFNRWGNLVYSANGYVNNWDGIGNNGNVLPDGTYFIVVDLNEEGKVDINGYIDLRRK